jgi:inner membrane protein
MPTIFSHAVAALSLSTAFGPALPMRTRVIGAVCAMVPDLDVIGFRFGVHYTDMLGHRGLSHSILFAVLLATVLTWLEWRRVERGSLHPRTWLFLFLATASHGILDALTNGGMGIAFFAPFDTTRYFFPVTPIAVSPIGAGFFSERGIAVIANELIWIWLPSVLFATLAMVAWRYRAKISPPTSR